MEKQASIKFPVGSIVTTDVCTDDIKGKPFKVVSHNLIECYTGHPQSLPNYYRLTAECIAEGLSGGIEGSEHHFRLA